MNKKILILGCRSRLGQYLIERLNNETIYDIIVSSNLFDICNQQNILNLITEIKPNIIINCIAYTNVDKAEIEVDKCMQTNGYALAHLAKCCEQNNIKLIHISSDFVYGNNEDGVYICESNPLTPINVYGTSKMIGEQKIIDNMDQTNYLILRVSWLFGCNGNNFVKSIFNNLQNNKELHVVNDQFGRPTSHHQIYEAIIKNINDFKGGIYNLSCTGPITSKYYMALYIANLLNYHGKIKNVSSSFFNLPARRQYNSVMKLSKIERIDIILYNWMNEVAEYVSYLQKKQSLFKRLLYKIKNLIWYIWI